MRQTIFLFLIISSIFLFACEGKVSQQKDITINPDSVTSVFPTDDSIPEDLIIRLKRTVCFGKCPAYMLTIKADGKVSFFGQDHTKVKGQAEGEISEEKLKQLIEEFKKVKFFDLEDNYLTGNCDTDSPTVHTTLFINGKTKKIEHNLGCKEPKELTELENKIDEIVGAEKWIGK